MGWLETLFPLLFLCFIGIYALGSLIFITIGFLLWKTSYSLSSLFIILGGDRCFDAVLLNNAFAYSLSISYWCYNYLLIASVLVIEDSLSIKAYLFMKNSNGLLFLWAIVLDRLKPFYWLFSPNLEESSLQYD